MMKFVIIALTILKVIWVFCAIYAAFLFVLAYLGKLMKIERADEVSHKCGEFVFYGVFYWLIWLVIKIALGV